MIPCQPHRNNAAGWLKPTGQGMASWRSWRKCYEFGRGVSWLEAPRALHSCGWTKPQANGPVLDQWGTKNVSTSKKRTRILSTLFNIAFFPQAELRFTKTWSVEYFLLICMSPNMCPIWWKPLQTCSGGPKQMCWIWSDIDFDGQSTWPDQCLWSTLCLICI